MLLQIRGCKTVLVSRSSSPCLHPARAHPCPRAPPRVHPTRVRPAPEQLSGFTQELRSV